MQKPIFWAILTVLLWSFSSTLARFISLSSPYLLFSISFACALLIFLIRARKVYGDKLITKLRTIPVSYFFVGILGYYAIWLGNTKSFQSFDSASETTVLNYTWLVFTVLFSQLIFNRPVKLTTDIVLRNLGILLCFVAVYFLAVEGNLRGFNYTHVRGVLWGLFGGASYGFFSAYSSRVPQKDHILFLIAAVAASLPVMIITFVLHTGHIASGIAEITLRDVLFALAIGIFVDAFGYMTWTRALQQGKRLSVDVAKVASIVFLLPVTSLVIVFVVFREITISEPYFLKTLILLLAGIGLAQKSTAVSRFLLNKR